MDARKTMASDAGSERLFVGRAETVDFLRRRLDEVRAEKSGVSLVVGDAGVGKSTLLTQLAADSRARGLRVLIGRSPAVDDPPPFSLIQSVLDGAQADPTLRIRPSPFQGSPLSEAGATRAVPGGPPSSATDFEKELLEAVGVTGNRVKIPRDLLLTRTADWFLEFSSEGPTVLLLDDLHRADESSLHALEFVVKQLGDQPLWVVGTSPRLGSLTEVRRARLEAFERSTHAEQVPLRSLTLEEVGGYLQAINPARHLTAEELERRYTETGGNPLLLQQLDRRLSSGSPLHDRPPAGLFPIDEEAQRALDVAAALGPEFSFDLLVGASGEDEEHLMEVVDRLVDRGLLLERPGGLLEFPQDRLREQAYSHLTGSQRLLIHRRAGETREALEGAGSARIFGLARDFYLGREDLKSLEYNRFAAEMANRALAPDIAREFLVRALESQRSASPDDLEGEANLVLELGRLDAELGRLEEAEGILRGFLNREKDDKRLPTRLRATFELSLAGVLHARGDVGGTMALSERLLSTPGLENDVVVRVGAHRLMGVGLYYQGRYPEALSHNTEALRLARESGNEELIGLALMWHSGVLAMVGQSDQALVEARQVVSIYDRLGSATKSAQGHLFLGNMLADNKSNPQYRQEALVVLDKTVRLGEEAQDPRRAGWALYHSSEVLRELGRVKEADEKAQRAYVTLGRIGDRIGQGVSIKVRGQIATGQGSYDVAQTHLLEALRLIQGLHHTLEEIDVVLRLAQLSSARGDRAGALRYIAVLERLKLPTARPDLATEFEQLRGSLAAIETGPAKTPT